MNNLFLGTEAYGFIFFEKSNFQKKRVERGAATIRATLASEGETDSKNWYKKRYRHP